MTANATATADMTDEQMVDQIVELAARIDRRPGRKLVMSELGVGTGRASRLLEQYRDRIGVPVHAVPDSDERGSDDEQCTGTPGTGGAPVPPSSEDAPVPPGDALGQDTTGTGADAPVPPAHQDEAGAPGQGTRSAEPEAPASVHPGPTGTDAPVPPSGAGAPGQDSRAAAESTGGTGAAGQVHRATSTPGTPRHAAPVHHTAGTGAPVQGRARAWFTRHRAVLAVLVISLPAAVAIWSGWVGMGGLTGFGVVDLLPGIAPVRLNTAVTLPIGIEAYAAMALHVWLTRADRTSRAARYARRSAIGSLVVGAAGQVAYHLMSAANVQQAPAVVTVFVAVLPVAVLGMATSLVTIVRTENRRQQAATDE